VTESSLEDVFISVVLKYDKIIDDDETGEPKLIPIVVNQMDSFEEEQPLQVIPPINILNEKKPSEIQYGSVLDKSR
jgi:hypothetical protein